MERVRRGNAEADREHLAAVTFYSHGPHDLNFLAMHPCTTFTRLYLEATATCHGCGRTEVVDRHALLDGPLAHRPWIGVMAALVCGRCGSRPSEVRFRKDGSDVGAASIHPKLELRKHYDRSFSRPPDVSHGRPDPEAQHDEGAP